MNMMLSNPFLFLFLRDGRNPKMLLLHFHRTDKFTHSALTRVLAQIHGPVRNNAIVFPPGLKMSHPHTYREFRHALSWRLQA